MVLKDFFQQQGTIPGMSRKKTSTPSAVIAGKCVGRDEMNLAANHQFASLAANDVIDLRCADETSAGKTITFHHVSVGLVRVSR